MNAIYSYVQVCSLFFLLIFTTSNNGQNEINTPQDNTVRMNTIPNDTTSQKQLFANQNSRTPALHLTPNLSEQISGVVRKIFQDKKGNLWFGTEDGACRYNGVSLVFFNDIRNQFGQGVTIKDIAEDREGNIWFATTGGVSKYDGESITNYTEKDGLINNDVWSIAISRNGIIWIGTLQGVCYFNGKVFTPFAIPEAKPDSTRGVTSAKIVHCIMEDSKGKIWFGTNGGAYIYDGKSLSNISEKDGLCNNNVGCISEDKEGNTWFATTHNGLCRFDGNSFTAIGEKNGLSGKEVWVAYQDHAGNMWFSGKRFGVYRYDGYSLTHFTEKDGLTSPGIMSIFEDKEGRLWLGGVSGLFRYNGKSFFRVTKNGPWVK